MATYRRIDRVNQLLREELARLVRREVKDPRVRGVTVTDVEATPDLAHAKVFVRTLRDEDPVEEAIQGLESAEGWLRRKLGKELHIRRVPEFEFEADRTLEKARRIEELLDQVHGDEEESGGEDEGAGEGDAPADAGSGSEGDDGR